MDNYERNAHFQDSARQVSYKILDLGLAPLSAYSRDDQKLVAEIIAQYAYDQVYHAIEFLRYSPYIRSMQLTSTDTWVDIIPDLTEWPKTASE